MVYIRNKKVKGIDYAYLVQSVWDRKRNSSRQHTVKYLGKATQVTLEDIPEEYRNDSKILTFISAFSSYQEKKNSLVSKIQEEMFSYLVDCNLEGLISLYEKYSKLFGLTEFYDKLLKPAMYRIGDLWKQGKLNAATEHASTNTAISLIKVINERMITKVRAPGNSSRFKIVICTPEGERHGLACNMIESLLTTKGFKVYNISTSIPTEYIVDYIADLQPDIVFVSITLSENIRPAERLIQQVHLRFNNNRLPIVVGGSAFNKIDQYNDGKINAFLMKDASFDDVMKLVKTNISESTEPGKIWR